MGFVVYCSVACSWAPLHAAAAACSTGCVTLWQRAAHPLPSCHASMCRHTAACHKTVLMTSGSTYLESVHALHMLQQHRVVIMTKYQSSNAHRMMLRSCCLQQPCITSTSACTATAVAAVAIDNAPLGTSRLCGCMPYDTSCTAG